MHVHSEGCPEVRRTVAFRDRLRADEADGELYAQTASWPAGSGPRYSSMRTPRPRWSPRSSDTPTPTDT